MNPTTIYLVRHGEVRNPDDIFYARLPGFRLSKRGEKEASGLAEYLRSKPIRAIYTSPLERARQTAGYLAARSPNIPVIYDDRLLEIRTPTEGMKFSILRGTNFNYFTDALISQGGERMEDIWDRMNSFLEEIGANHAGEHVAVFSHGDPIMITKAALTGKPLTLDSIRTGEYVGHAKGITITRHGPDDFSIEDMNYR